jgi:hypothetical protein
MKREVVTVVIVRDVTTCSLIEGLPKISMEVRVYFREKRCQLLVAHSV